MGISAWWVAFRGDPDQALDALGLERTGEIVDPLDADAAGIQRGGWYVVVSSAFDRVPLPAVRRTLSRAAPTVWGALDEPSMASEFEEWAGGEVRRSLTGAGHEVEAPLALCEALTGFRPDTVGEGAEVLQPRGLSRTIETVLELEPQGVLALATLAARAIDQAFVGLAERQPWVAVVGASGPPEVFGDHGAAKARFARKRATEPSALVWAGETRSPTHGGNILVTVGHPEARADLLVRQQAFLGPVAAGNHLVLHNEVSAASAASTLRAVRRELRNLPCARLYLKHELAD